MSRLRSLAPSGWVAVGLLLGAIALPTAAIAAFSDVRIVGLSGSPQAQVTPANQLRVATTDPSRYQQFNGSFPNNACTNIGTVHATGGFILKQATFDVRYDSVQGSSSFDVHAGANCSGPIIVSVTPTGEGPVHIPLDPGFGLPAGTTISAASTGVDANSFLLGYTTPTSAVPSITPVTKPKGFSARLRARKVNKH
jgi:hypothetical protein